MRSRISTTARVVRMRRVVMAKVEVSIGSISIGRSSLSNCNKTIMLASRASLRTRRGSIKLGKRFERVSRRATGLRMRLSARCTRKATASSRNKPSHCQAFSPITERFPNFGSRLTMKSAPKGYTSSCSWAICPTVSGE